VISRKNIHLLAVFPQPTTLHTLAQIQREKISRLLESEKMLIFTDNIYENFLSPVLTLRNNVDVLTNSQLYFVYSGS